MGLAEGDADGIKVGSKLGLSEGMDEIVGVDDGEDDDVGIEDGMLELSGVGIGEGFPNPPSEGIGWMLMPDIGPDGRNDGRSIGPEPESQSLVDPPPGRLLLSYTP